jgi:hypothetical protein
VAVADHVDGQPIEGELDVGAVVGVEAAQEELVGLPAARVLDDHQSGGDPQQIRRLQHRPQLEVLVAHGARRGGGERALRLH